MSFKEDIVRFIQVTEKDAEKVRRAVILDLFKGIVKGTPVDTGRLRAAWQMTPIGGDLVTISNSLPYAFTAEFGLWNHATEKTTSSGYSSQAPAGMVRLNVENFQKYVDKAVKKYQS